MSQMPYLLIPAKVKNFRRYSEAINILYQSNTFCFLHVTTLQSFYNTILCKRWALIRSLYFNWQWWPTVRSRFQDGSHYVEVLESYGRDVWESVCQSVKMLTALRRFTLVLGIPGITRDPDE